MVRLVINSEQVNESSQRTIPQNLSDPRTTEIGRRSEETGAESTVEQGSGSISGSPTLDRDHLVPASNRNTERSETLSSQNNQSTESQSNPNHKKSRAIQEQINAFLRNLDPLGINFDRAKYPAYAVLATRVSSFQDWPTSLTQTRKFWPWQDFSMQVTGITHAVSSAGEDYVIGSQEMILGQNMPDGFQNAPL